MIIILGLVVLAAALVVGVAGVLGNGGGGDHALPHGFAMLGYHVTGSTGSLFLVGILVGAVGVLGLSLLLAGARRTSRRRRAARGALQQSRRENVAAGRDREDGSIGRETAHYTPSAVADPEPAATPDRAVEFP